MSYWTEDNKSNICAGHLEEITGRSADSLTVFTVTCDDALALAMCGYSFPAGTKLYP